MNEDVIYVVEWRRAYSEYGICFITKDMIDAELALVVHKTRFGDELDFEIKIYPVNKDIEIWE